MSSTAGYPCVAALLGFTMHPSAIVELQLYRHGARDDYLACKLRQLQIVMLNAPLPESNVITKWVQANTSTSATVFVHATLAKRYVHETHLSCYSRKEAVCTPSVSDLRVTVSKPLRGSRSLITFCFKASSCLLWQPSMFRHLQSIPIGCGSAVALLKLTHVLSASPICLVSYP